MYRYLILMWLCATSLTIIAQEEDRIHNHKVSMEEMQKKQLDYFTKELDLDQAQSDKLAPILQQYMRDRFQVFHGSHRKKSKSPMTESEYKEAIDRMLASKTKETELQNNFYNDLLKILPAEKVYKYHSAEKRYFRDTLKNRKNRLK